MLKQTWQIRPLDCPRYENNKSSAPRPQTCINCCYKERFISFIEFNTFLIFSMCLIYLCVCVFVWFTNHCNILLMSYSVSQLLLGLYIIMTVFERQVTQMTRDDVHTTEIDFQTVSTDGWQTHPEVTCLLPMTVVSKRSRMRRGHIQSQKMLMLPSVQWEKLVLKYVSKTISHIKFLMMLLLPSIQQHQPSH